MRSKPTTLFDPGKILLWAEQGLTSISLAMERKTDKFLKKWHQKDQKKQQIRNKEKQKKKEHRELAKDQDSKLEYLEGIEKRQDRDQIQERLGELNYTEQDISQDAELDRD